MGIDKVLTLNVLLKRRKNVFVLVLTFVCELSISDPVRWSTDIFGANDLWVVVRQILCDPLLRAWRTTYASASADLHQGLDIARLAFADTLSIRAFGNRLNLGNYKIISWAI